MQSIRKIDKINVTYYVHPQHFYFKYADDVTADAELDSINKNVEKYVRQHIEQRCRIPHSPTIGEIVLCHYISDCVNKWIRARVDAKLTYAKDKFILWAIDYGFPLESEPRWIRPLLSDDLKVVSEALIFKGGLFDIVPCTYEWDFIESTKTMRKTKKWSSNAVQSIEKYIHEADILSFRCRAYYKDHFFGSLIIQSNTGTKMVVADYLREYKEGEDSVCFLKEFSKLENTPYWERQKNDAIYKIYDNNSDPTMFGDENATAMWTNDKAKSKLPQLKNAKEMKYDDTDETLIQLSDELHTAATLGSKRSIPVVRQIQPIAAADQASKRDEDVVPKLIDVGPIRIVPMNKRLEVAQQKMIEQDIPESHEAVIVSPVRTDFKSTQIVDRRTGKNLQVFNNSDSASIDLDDSDISHLNWTASTDDVDAEASAAPVYEKLINSSMSSSSSAQEGDLLRLSKDEWAELTANEFNKILLCNFYHPNRIYIRSHQYSSRLTDLNKQIDEFTALPTNLIQLSDVNLAQNCLAKINDRFSRAKIMKLFHDPDGITAEVFFVDLGEFIVLPVNELIEVPKTLIAALPFQAIFCQLIGVRPIDSSKWCDTICDNIFDNLLVKQSHFYTRPMQNGGPDKYAYGLRSRSYQVVLLDEIGNNINSWIVLNHHGEWHPDTKQFVDVAVSEVHDCLEKANSDDDDDLYGSFDVQFDHDDIMKLLQQINQPPLPSERRVEPPLAEITEIFEEATTNELVDEKIAGKNSSSVADDKIELSTEWAGLISVHKFPNVKWHQTDQHVVLTIHAPDAGNYFLKINPRLVHTCFTTNQEQFAAAINLFGCVDVEKSSHGIRGLNIVIRLVKSLNRFSWPRLVQTKEKLHWLQYNFDAKCAESKEFDSEEMMKKEAAIRHDKTQSSDAESVTEDDDEIDLDI